MNVALRAAENSECRQRHGAVVVKNGNILSIGINKGVNHPTIMSEEHIRTGAADHAEVVALRRVANPAGATIYVARVLRSGRPGNSKPCSECQSVLDEAGVKKIIYTH